MVRRLRRTSGSVLVFALWALAILTILAANLGLGVRQKITLLSRLEARNKIRLSAESGVKKAAALLTRDLKTHQFVFNAEAKMFRQNNARSFGKMRLKDATATVSYDRWEGLGFRKTEAWGAVDEESKLNLNTTNFAELKRLCQALFEWDEKTAQEFAQAILEWRSKGTTELKGFYSEEYYNTAEHNYAAKNENYELLDELLLVKGIDHAVYETIAPFLTVYGSGRVNINTAPRPVLIALGMSDELADKVLTARRGEDLVEATMDDYIFQRTYDIASELGKLIPLNPDEIATIDRLNSENKFDTNSVFYSIRARAYLADNANPSGRSAGYTIQTVLNGPSGKIVYWKEEY